MKSATIDRKETGNEQVKLPSLPPKAPYFYYRDFSDVSDPDPSKPVTPHGRIPNFPAKMMAILSRPDLAHIISWMPHGRSWKVHKPREFEVRVIPTYFEHSKFSSFIRQANGWGFRRMIAKGPDRNSYYHETFLRGMPHLIKLMKRPTVTTRPPSDAATEPDFYRIAEELPLPELKLETKEDHDAHLSTSEKKMRTSSPKHLTKVPESPRSSSSSGDAHDPSPYAFEPPSPEVYPVYHGQPGVSPDSYSYAPHVVMEVPPRPPPPAFPSVVSTLPPSAKPVRVMARAVDSLEALTPIPVHCDRPEYRHGMRTVSPSYQPMAHSRQNSYSYQPHYTDYYDQRWAPPHPVQEPPPRLSEFEDPFAGGLTPIDFW